jgi:hypothetical protein
MVRLAKRFPIFFVPKQGVFLFLCFAVSPGDDVVDGVGCGDVVFFLAVSAECVFWLGEVSSSGLLPSPAVSPVIGFAGWWRLPLGSVLLWPVALRAVHPLHLLEPFL